MTNLTGNYTGMPGLGWDAFNHNNSSGGHNLNISATTISTVLSEVSTSNSSALNRTLSSPWETLSKAYQGAHGYFSFTVCVFGIISNVLNIIVLTRKHMRSPVNFILTALAIADILTMSPYTVMAIYLYILTKPECHTANHSESWMYFVMFHNLFIIACHMMATWLTVSLAVFRYIFVCKHQLALFMCSMKRARITVLTVFVATIVSNIPYLFMYQVKNYQIDTDEPCYWIAASAFALNNPMYINFVHWLYGVVIKILPCILLAYLSTLIIIAMQQAKKRRARLLNNISRVIDHESSNEHHRTTMMLVAVVLCFIITEIPQGLLAWISAVDTYFYNNVFFHLGDIMDILVLINSAVNFILYCIMSQQFRNTFTSLFVAKHFPPIFHRAKKHPNGGDYSIVHTETTHV